MNNTTEGVGNLSLFMRYDLESLYMRFIPEAVVLDKVVSPIWYTIGIFCNVLSARIWLDARIRRNTSSAVYLGALAVSDWIFLILHIITELHYAWGYTTFNRPISCEIFLVIYIIPQYCAPLFVLGFTVERFIAVCFPFKKEMYCTVRRAVFVVIGLLCFAIALGMCQAYLWTYSPEQKVCNYREEVLVGGDLSFSSIWSWTTDVCLNGFIPLAVLLFNIRVIFEIRRLTSYGPAFTRNSGSDSKASTVTLLCVSFYLIFTLLPATIIFCCQQFIHTGDPALTDDEVSQDATWNSFFRYYFARVLINEWCLSRSACNFFIYFFTGQHFRNCFFRIFPCLTCCRCSDKESMEKGSYHAVSHSNGATLATTL